MFIINKTRYRLFKKLKRRSQEKPQIELMHQNNFISLLPDGLFPSPKNSVKLVHVIKGVQDWGDYLPLLFFGSLFIN